MEPMAISLIRDEVLAILLAGVEATAAALAWTCYLLSQYPATADRLHAEVGIVLGDRRPTPDDLDRLPLTRMVVQEVLRLYPPVPWFGRVAMEPDRIAEYDVPAGTAILFSPYVMHRHPLYWDHPERFVPERFIPAKVSRRPSCLYFPFGGGPRTCLGNHFAVTEMQVVTALLTRRFRLHLAPDTKVEHGVGLTMRPTGPLPMHVERRIGIVRG
jgi:cytochrome P450